ncbi:hypothetical protein ACHAWF_009406 [Thalassiosira exigua]
MASRFFSSSSTTSALLRSALAAHAGLSATSLLRSAVGPSQLPEASSASASVSGGSTRHLQQHHHHPSPTSASSLRFDPDRDAVALPWLNQLQVLIAELYVDGGADPRAAGVGVDGGAAAVVRLGDDVALENPLVSHAGADAVGRAFRGRARVRPQEEVETVLERVEVTASDDSICGGGADGRRGKRPDGMLELVGVPETFPLHLAWRAEAPPQVEVTYRLTRRYGSSLSTQSLITATVQVRRGCPERVLTIASKRGELAVPLATSGVAPRVRSSAVAAVATSFGHFTSVLAQAASEMVGATKGRGSETDLAPSVTSSVAEVVRIEEKWNGVELLQFAPFHWSRCLNGLVAGAYYFFFA